LPHRHDPQGNSSFSRNNFFVLRKCVDPAGSDLLQRRVASSRCLPPLLFSFPLALFFAGDPMVYSSLFEWRLFMPTMGFVEIAMIVSGMVLSIAYGLVIWHFRRVQRRLGR
jgi:hypothetical protein